MIMKLTFFADYSLKAIAVYSERCNWEYNHMRGITVWFSRFYAQIT